jgi:hypothetical protein
MAMFDSGDAVMGFALVWLAVQGVGKAELAGLAGLEDTGEPDDFFEGAYSVGELAGGELVGKWAVLVASDFALLEEEILHDFSQGRRLVACAVEEHVMISSCSEWVNGAPVWSATHIGEDGGDELEVAGVLPPVFEGIVAKLRALEAQNAEEDADEGLEVDYIFDAPLELAEAITGFRHDAVFEGVFTACEPAE